jgi:fructose PTS system EIIBC or EIIC component
MTLAQYTEPRLLVRRLLSNDRPSAIAELSRRLEKAGRIENARAFTEAALDHESLVPPVFEGVAFPLARGQAVRDLSFALGLSPQGIRWGAGRAPFVRTVVLFAVPLSAGAPYLSLVVRLSNFLQDETAFSNLRQCAQPEEMLAVLEQVRVPRTGPQLAAAPT